MASSSSSSSSFSDNSLAPPDHVVILYASETGNAQDTAERVGREFRRVGRRCKVLSMDMFDIFDLPHTQLLILITSTHGRGDPPPAMLPLWTALLRSSLPDDILEDVQYSIYGLGDSSYERFCYAGKMLARRMEALGATKLVEPAWGDERAPDGIEETYIPWLRATLDAMLPLMPEPADDFAAPSSTSLPPSIYTTKRVDAPKTDHLPSVASLSIDTKPNGDHTTQTAPIRATDAVRHVASEIWKPDDWGIATLTKNKRITSEDWWQDVREIELRLGQGVNHEYAPGSICSLQPKSDPVEVDEYLERMDMTDMADDVLILSSNIEEQPMPPHLPPAGTPTTLRTLLTNHLDIRASPRKSFFEWLRRLSPDEMEQERLDDFISDPDEIHTYATRPSRTILETLADFRHTRIPLSHILEILPPLRRRQFSIASSSAGHPGKVQLLVALVEYKTNLKIPRRGLCSSWLETLTPGIRLPIKIDPPTLILPAPSKPLILVGPGTGVAPMRAFIEERIRQRAINNTILYFGCRSAKEDYFYASEWAEYRKLGLRVEVAASRDQEEKIYVQDLMRRDKDTIKDFLVDQQGYIFISGSSNAMPRQVREAIAWSISREGAGEISSEQATEYVEVMFESGRGGEESW